MSVFGSIMSKIFGGSASAETGTAHASDTPSVSAAAQGSDGPTGSASSAAAPSMSGAPAPGGPAGSGPGSVDVGEVFANLAAQKGGPSDYKRSIVDLLKLLDLDSSLPARKQLADELHYMGDKEDSATMNIWLHKQVIQKLADNGGKVPDDLKHA